jgi:DNA-binding CsgD family transcriptional regulator
MVIQPNPETMRQHLDALFSDAANEYPDGLCEIAWTDARGKLSRGRMFPMTKNGFDEAVVHAIDVNKEFNVYVGVNPRKPGTPTGRANGESVEIAFSNFIDLDDGNAVAALPEKSRKLPGTFIVITGREPSLRIHAYWKLDEPVRNLKAWESQQAAMAAHFLGDPVTDAPRVMRLAGTVSYPSAKKIEKGYRPELVTLQIDEDRDPVCAHDLAAAYPLASHTTAAVNPASLSERLGVGGFNITPCISEIDAGKNLHNNSRNLVAHLVNKNYDDYFIQDYLTRILQPVSDGGTINELPKLIASARQKFQAPDPADAKLQADDIDSFLALVIPPREMVLTPFLPTQGLVMLFAMRGIGKTHLSLGIGYAVASGGTFLRWAAPKARRVLFIDGEMPAATMQERIAAIVTGADKEVPSAGYLRIVTPDRQENGIPDLSTAAGQAAVEAILGNTELLILDNLSSLFRSGRENEAEGWVPVQAWLLSLRRRGVSVLFVHHAGKQGRQRGTSYREDVLDTIISLRRPGDYQATEGARFEVHYEKSRGFTGNDALPFEAQLETMEGAAKWTIKDLEDSRAEQVARYINDGYTQKETSDLLGINKSGVSRHVKKARELGLIIIDGDKE